MVRKSTGAEAEPSAESPASGTLKKPRARLTPEEKAARHLKSVREYYQRNPALKEKNRLRAAERRAAVKARRRKWDPVKVAAHLSDDSRSCHHTPGFSDPRAANTVVPSHRGSINNDVDPERPSEAHGAVGTSPLLTPMEAIACDALATLAQGGAGPPHADPSTLASVDPVHNELPGGRELSPAGRIDLRRLPSGVTPLSFAQDRELASGALILTPVQIAQIHVAELNSAALTPPTEAEKRRWAEVGEVGGMLVPYFSYAQQQAVCHWRVPVYGAMLKERRRQRIEALGLL
ncbi:hypothetical protein B0H15DRAFT_951699 [Mycena belliarum]|uniref:Uncharacterized protein n=1 Tax=Mycena belliarum TaxID=1033014 RepID=A0AAD6U3Z8_9AGAR|nr:hypothetical protein B0H15DRAFT_951699 [Mycena belliae]